MTMNCESHQLMISKLSDGELPPEECALIFTHLGICASCREFYAQLQRLQRALSRERETGIPAGTLPTTIRRERSLRRRHLWTRTVRVPLLVAALVAGSFLLSLYFSLTRHAGTETVFLMTLPQVVVHPN
jgi:predicted anti-sigma-YlaC factor YlaD